MLIPALIAASMMMVSDRSNFWDSDTIAPQTQYGDVSESGITKLLDESAIDRFAHKKVLIMVHGFATYDACYPYFTVQTNVLGRTDSYDETIGYIWPCNMNHLTYLDARNNADAVAPRLKEFILKLRNLGAQIDVVAHSMGNRLVMQALNFSEDDPFLVTNFLAVAPAVDNEAIEKGEEFYLSTQHCLNFFVFFSERDDVLKWVYPVPEFDRALGYKGAEHPARLSKNVQLIDCTAIIDGHDAYLFSKPIFDFIHQMSSMQIPGPNLADRLTFKANGMFEVASWRNMMKMGESFWDRF
ncbi:MAG: alpha/beta hydrolase [Verrucomicrobia bacterium]|nr:alpha/beta hydrolase [Verrucomicrobiota bacterium]